MTADLMRRVDELERELKFARAAKPSPYKTPIEAAEYLRLFDGRGNPDVRKIYNLRTRYHLRARKVGGLLRFHVQDLDRFAGNDEIGPRSVEGGGPRG